MRENPAFAHPWTDAEPASIDSLRWTTKPPLAVGFMGSAYSNSRIARMVSKTALKKWILSGRHLRGARVLAALNAAQVPLKYMMTFPRDRAGTFAPQLVPKGATRLDGFDGQIISLYARGLTVREIQGHLKELYGTEVSPDLISRVTDAVLEEVKEWQSRPLDACYPIIFFDALRVKIRDEGLVRSKAVYVALAIDTDGQKHVLGLWIEQSEGAKFWLKVMNDLKARGLEDILIAVVDGLKGFPDAIGAVYPKTIVQTCIVHLIRSSMRFVSWKNRKQVMPDLKAIYRAENAEAAQERLSDFEAKWGTSYPAIGDTWRRAWEHVVPLFAFPPAIRKMVYTTDEMDKRLARKNMLWTHGAGDSVAKNGTPAASSVRPPFHSPAGLERPRTFGRISHWTTKCS